MEDFETSVYYRLVGKPVVFQGTKTTIISTFFQDNTHFFICNGVGPALTIDQLEFI